MTVRARGMLFGLLVSFISLAAHAQDHVILRDGTARQAPQISTHRAARSRYSARTAERLQCFESSAGIGPDRSESAVARC